MSERIPKHLKTMNYDRWASLYWKKQLETLSAAGEKELDALEKENIELLNKHRIKYLLIGCFAAVLYGVSRSTFDKDIAISMDTESISNATSLLSGLGFVEKEKLEGGVRLTDGRVEIDHGRHPVKKTSKDAQHLRFILSSRKDV